MAKKRNLVDYSGCVVGECFGFNSLYVEDSEEDLKEIMTFGNISFDIHEKVGKMCCLSDLNKSQVAVDAEFKKLCNVFRNLARKLIMFKPFVERNKRGIV